jgi:hypothetical protein
LAHMQPTGWPVLAVCTVDEDGTMPCPAVIVMPCHDVVWPQVVPTAGVSVTNVDMTDMEAVKAAIRPGVTKLVLIESPTNPRMQVRWESVWCLAHVRTSVPVSLDIDCITCVGSGPLDFVELNRPAKQDCPCLGPTQHPTNLQIQLATSPPLPYSAILLLSSTQPLTQF